MKDYRKQVFNIFDIYLNFQNFLRMNILELTDQFDNIQSQNCKVNYLEEQNKLMQSQSNALNEVSNTYKKLLDYVTCESKYEDSESSNDSSITKQRQIMVIQYLNESNQIIEKWESRWEQRLAKQNIEEHQPNISNEFFLNIVLSYEESISNLKSEIKKRENTLQYLEKGKTKSQSKENNYENNVVIKAIQSYDIYNKISDRCRHQIMELKFKKKQIEDNKLQRLYGKKDGIQKQNNEWQTDKTIKKVPAFKEPTSMLPDDKISTFEKTILLYKKKKMLNQIRQSKLIELKKKIKQKEYCNTILKKKIQQENWQQLVELDYVHKHQALDQMDSFSVYGCPDISNIYDFSVDLSRVIPENFNKKKNYLDYKAQNKLKN